MSVVGNSHRQKLTLLRSESDQVQTSVDKWESEVLSRWNMQTREGSQGKGFVLAFDSCVVISKSQPVGLEGPPALVVACRMMVAI